MTLWLQQGEHSAYLHSVVDLRGHFCVGSSFQKELRGGVSVQRAGQGHLQQQTHTPDRKHTHYRNRGRDASGGGAAAAGRSSPCGLRVGRVVPRPDLPWSQADVSGADAGPLQAAGAEVREELEARQMLRPETKKTINMQRKKGLNWEEKTKTHT